MRAHPSARVVTSALLLAYGAGCAVGRAVLPDPQPDASMAQDSAPHDDARTGTDAPSLPDVNVPHDAPVGGTDVPTATDTPVACTPVLTVNELQTGGAMSAGDEFLEIYNAGACRQSLAGWQLQYSSAAGSVPAMRWTGLATDAIGPMGYFVVASTAFAGHADATFTLAGGTFAAGGGAVGLFDAMGTRVDSVEYGVAMTTLAEGAPAVAPTPGQSIARTPDGHDTNANASDFHAGAPTPGAANR